MEPDYNNFFFPCVVYISFSIAVCMRAYVSLSEITAMNELTNSLCESKKTTEIRGCKMQKELNQYGKRVEYWKYSLIWHGHRTNNKINLMWLSHPTICVSPFVWLYLSEWIVFVLSSHFNGSTFPSLSFSFVSFCSLFPFLVLVCHSCDHSQRYWFLLV